MDIENVQINDYVKIAPHTDLFMRGVRYGTVVKIGRKWLTIRHELSDRTFKVSAANVELAPITIPRPWTRIGGTDHLVTVSRRSVA